MNEEAPGITRELLFIDESPYTLSGPGTGDLQILGRKGQRRYGKLQILNLLGGVLHEIDLAAPKLADIDGDPDLEVGANTAYSKFGENDLLGTDGAQILWGKSRGNYWRDGYLP